MIAPVEELFPYIRMVTLERVEIATGFRISEDQMRLSKSVDLYTGDHIIRAVLDFFGRKEFHVIVRPASWWDGFKEAYFPAWAVKLWPIRHEMTKITAVTILPEWYQGPQFPWVESPKVVTLGL